jgi:hypothetical protein
MQSMTPEQGKSIQEFYSVGLLMTNTYVSSEQGKGLRKTQLTSPTQVRAF